MALHSLMSSSFTLPSGTPGTSVPGGQPFVGTFSGWLTVPAGVSGFVLQTNGGVLSLAINGQGTSGYPTGPSGECALDEGQGNVNDSLAGVPAFQVSASVMWPPNGPAPSFSLDWVTGDVPGGAQGGECDLLETSPVSVDPGYNYVTSTEVDNAGTGTSSALTDYAYGDPAHGLKTEQVVDPSGQDLVTHYSYEGASGFYEPSSTTLPAGNSTTDTYYNGTDAALTAADPCVPGSPAVDQGDGLYQQATPGRTQTYVYDSAGQVVASRLSASDGWSCTSYDSRGRVTEVSYPALGTTPAYTDTYDYQVGGDPLVTSVTKAVSGGASSTITTTVDLLGQTVSYTDANANTTTTTYDQAGRATSSCTTPAGAGSCASTLATTYDNLGRVASDSYNGATADTPSYDAYSNLTGAAYGNGTALGYTYDAEGRLTGESFTQSGGATLVSDSEALSQAGDVESDTEAGPSAGGLGQLHLRLGWPAQLSRW